jgi:hypothetical protein
VAISFIGGGNWRTPLTSLKKDGLYNVKQFIFMYLWFKFQVKM